MGLRGQVGAVWERALILAFSHKVLIGGRLLALGRGLDARDTLILAFSRKGLIGGRLLALGRGLDARDTLILAFSHKGRRDPLASIVSGWWLVVRGWGAGGVSRLGARASRPQSRACARRTLILAFSHKGRRDPLAAVCTWFRVAGLAVWERGRPARNAALARGDTLILAFSRKGRRDPLAADCAWFCVKVLAASVWIPAFAGMTRGRNREWRGEKIGNGGEWNRE